MAHVEFDRDALAAFCHHHHIRRLSLFGSVLRDDFRAESDVDVLVEFEEGHVPNLFRMNHMQEELSGLVGRPVDLRTREELGHRFRDRVVGEAVVAYASDRS